MSPDAREQELELATAAASGCEDAWHEVIDRYSGLIYSMIRRYVSRPSEDEWRSIYVEVLESMHKGGLKRYDGRASLGTWIGVVTRSRCMDHLRHEHGRHQDPVWLAALSARDREAYRLYYIEGQSFSQICTGDPGNPPAFSVRHLSEALDRIDRHLDRRTRRHLAYELEARSVSAVTGRLLEYFSFARQCAEEAQAAYRSDLRVLETETRLLLGRMQEALSNLDSEEREVLRLRYYDGLNAEGVAAEMGLESPRKVYTISNRAISKLRKILAIQKA